MKGFGYLLFILSCIAGVLMHCYTVFWVYMSNGMFWSFIAFCTPPFSEMIMAGASIASAGIFNQYLLIWVGILSMYGVGEAIVKYKENQYAD